MEKRVRKSTLGWLVGVAENLFCFNFLFFFSLEPTRTATTLPFYVGFFPCLCGNKD